jgi:hypothetical protein
MLGLVHTIQQRIRFKLPTKWERHKIQEQRQYTYHGYSTQPVIKILEYLLFNIERSLVVTNAHSNFARLTVSSKNTETQNLLFN